MYKYAQSNEGHPEKKTPSASRRQEKKTDWLCTRPTFALVKGRANSLEQNASGALLWGSSTT